MSDKSAIELPVTLEAQITADVAPVNTIRILLHWLR